MPHLPEERYLFMILRILYFIYKRGEPLSRVSNDVIFIQLAMDSQAWELSSL